MTSPKGEEEPSPDDSGQIGEQRSVRRPAATWDEILNLALGQTANVEIRGDTVFGEEDSAPAGKLVDDSQPGPTFDQVEQAKDRAYDRELRVQQHQQERVLREAELRHRSSMQKWVLFSIFGALVLMFSVVMVAAMVGKVSTEFATEMGRMVLPALVGSAGTIVGAMFIGGRKES